MKKTELVKFLMIRIEEEQEKIKNYEEWLKETLVMTTTLASPPKGSKSDIKHCCILARKILLDISKGEI